MAYKNTVSNIEIINGTNSTHTYIVVQELKKVTLAIKPEFHRLVSGVIFGLRVRAVADRGSIYGVTNHEELVGKVYPTFPWTASDSSRCSLFIRPEIPEAVIVSNVHADNGEQLVLRMINKLVDSMCFAIQERTGHKFLDYVAAVEFLTNDFFEQFKDYYEFNVLDTTPENIDLICETEANKAFMLGND